MNIKNNNTTPPHNNRQHKALNVQQIQFFQGLLFLI